MMRLVISTEILREAFVNHSQTHVYVLVSLGSQASDNPSLRLCLEHKTNFIYDDYERYLSNNPAYRQWMKHVIGYSSRANGILENRHRERLQQLGCKNTINHVFVSVAFCSDKVLITESDDFGKSPGGISLTHDDISKYLTNTMNIAVYSAYEAQEFIDAYKATVTNSELSVRILKEHPYIIIDLIEKNPNYLTLLEGAGGSQVLGVLFENQVCEYFRDKGYIVERNKYISDMEIDVYAENDEEVVICECEMRSDPNKQLISATKVRQALDRLDLLRSLQMNKNIAVWIISTSEQLEDGVNLWPKIEESQGAVQVWHFPLRRKVIRKIGHERWVGVLRDEWFIRDRVRQLYPHK